MAGVAGPGIAPGSRVLVVGAGGREHALVVALHDSPQHPLVFAAPGSPGMLPHAARVALGATDVEGIVGWARAEHPDLVVIGPEAPLAAGLADALRAEGIPALGPGREGARLETSKVHAKEIFGRLGLPTAGGAVVRDAAGARRALDGASWPLVLKADGLAAGKGVVIARERAEAEAAIRAWMEEGALGEAGRTLLLEEFLEGEEASLTVLADGERWVLLPLARDHKRVGDGDSGPNTGGMGAYAPSAVLGEADALAIAHTLADPVLAEMRRLGHPYRGVLYFGLMLTRHGPYVLEMNARFGDPETQAILPLLDEDVFDLLLRAARGAIPEERHGRFAAHHGATVCVVLASEGYPGTPRTGVAIEGLDRERPHGIHVFHAGVARESGRWLTAGGRVLGVTARAGTLELAREAAYAVAAGIRFEGMHYRRDIAARPVSAGGTRP
jgi:phosphoribosylamine--glycine ligase